MPNQSTAPLRHAVVLAHPDPHSFNAAVAEVYCNTVRECGQEAIFHDLYRMSFDPVLKGDERPEIYGFAVSPDVEAEIRALSGSDVFTIIHPVWFGMPPAIMIGYVDRVLGAGVTPKQVQEGAGKGLLNGCHMLTITTSGARAVWLDEQGQMESLRNLSGRYLSHAFSARSHENLHFGGIVEGFSRRFVDQNLYDVRERARKLCATVAAERHATAI